jgi:anti-sigma factor RsiW
MTCPRCEPVRRLLLECAYEELPPDAAAEVQSHLAECPQCAARSAALRQGIAALDKLTDTQETTAAPPSASPAAALRQSLPARHERQSRRWKAVAACAAVLAVAASVVACGRVRIVVSSSHLQITWGQPPRSSVPHPISAPSPRRQAVERDRMALAQVEQLRERLARQTRRLDELEAFANLAGRQTLETDDRLTAAVAELSRVLDEHRHRTQSELADLRELGDIRWQLIQHEQREREADLLTRVVHAAE